MRIIVVNDHGFVNGGAAQVAITGLNSLVEAGLDVTFVAGMGPIEPGIDARVNVVNLGLQDLLHNPSTINAAVSGIWQRHAAARLREILRDCQPRDTVIHLHTWTKVLSSSVVRVAIQRGFPIVCTLHDYFSVCPNGGLYNYPQKKLCGLTPMSLSCITSHCDVRNYPQKLWRVARQLVQHHVGQLPRGIKYAITVSAYSEVILRRWLPSGMTFFRVNNPIAIERQAPVDVASHDAFMFIGRLSPEKGAVLLAQAAVVAGVPSMFVGSGGEAERIRATNPRAQLLGWMQRADVLKTLRVSRALVFPSLWHETQGMAVLEAAACGVPAIVSDACAAKEAIVDGETGLLFRSGDPHDLAAKIAQLHTDPAFAATLGARAYERYWSAPHTLSNHVAALIKCYSHIVRAAV